ncbi:MAG: AAA family ATPase [Segetibacter sp.]
MPKLLIEYNGIPAIIDHTFEKIDKTTFIVAYKSDEFGYLRKDFKTIDSALEFEPDNKTKLVFIYLESQTENDLKRVLYKHIEFTTNKFNISGQVEKIVSGFKFSIEFGLSSFIIKKLKNNAAVSIYEFVYSRRKTIKKDTKTEFELVDSFYELIPRYEDIFLETIFLMDLLKTNPLISEKSEIEAYFLQSKIKIEDKKKPNKHKSDDTADEQPSSQEFIELENLIGLDKIKLEIQELKALAIFRQKRIELDLPVTPTTLHLVFTGNPGTGKTTVARLLGQIYFDIGILAENKVIEASRQDLVGEYVGHTAPKTQKIFEKALGGILFIDEAYSLFKTGNDFGKEAIETLLKLMEDNREKIVVIIAGYPKEIEDLLQSNPGLKSRFSKFLHYEDYNKEELFQIFMKMVSEYHNVLSEGAKYKMEHIIDTYFEIGAFNSNARAIRSIFEDSIKRQSLRLSKLESPTQEEMITFIDKDLPNTLE